MGCSPSKGQLFTGTYKHQDEVLQFGSHECNSNNYSNGAELQSQTETDFDSRGQHLLQEENTSILLQGKRHNSCDIVKESVDTIETNVHSQVQLQTREKIDKKDDRRMIKNECKRIIHTEKQRKSVYMLSNEDLPQVMVKAQQTACAYLKHNIPKYESLLGLLEKAKKTQLSLQPVVTLLTLQYEEIIQALDEIATEGEQMLEMHGNHMALSTVQSDAILSPKIPELVTESTESSPDLLKHMLHHLIKKTSLVGDSVQGLGATSLKDTGDYFNSVSQLLSVKLLAKTAAEMRLKHILACVESYALGKQNSEDTSLHSEDSGSGIEKECQNGSVRQSGCSHQESYGTSTQSSYGYPESILPHQPSANSDENDNVDKYTDIEDSNDDKMSKNEQGSNTNLTDRKTSHLSQSDPCQNPLQFSWQNNRLTNSTSEWSNEKEKNIRWPKSTDDCSVSCHRKHRHSHLWSPKRSRSADCLYRSMNDYMVQGQNRLQSNNQKLEWFTQRENSTQFNCLQDGNKEPFKPWLTSNSTPAFAPVPPGKHAVKRLIKTFNQGVWDSSKQKPFNGPKSYRGRKKSFLPTITKYRTGVSISDNKYTNINTNSYLLDKQISERHDNVDANSLPHPPPEVLMDNSFEKNEAPTSDEYDSKTQKPRFSTQRKECCVSHCPQTSLQTTTSLPSQDRISWGSVNISESCPNGQDFVHESHTEKNSDKPTKDKDKEKYKAIGFFQHSQKTVNLCHSTDILVKLGHGNNGSNKPLSERLGRTIILENSDSGEGQASTLYANSHTLTTQPFSKSQSPPSSDSKCHRVSSPTLSRTCPFNGQGKTSTASYTSKIQRWTRGSGDDNGFMTASTSISFYEARSMFCQENQSASQSDKHTCRSVLPRPKGKPNVSKGKGQSTCLPQNIGRMNRPTLTDHQLLLPSVTEPHNSDSEADILNSWRKVPDTAQSWK